MTAPSGRTECALYSDQSDYGRCLACLNAGGRYLMGNPRLWKMLRAGPSSWRSDKRVMFAFGGEKIDELEALADLLERGLLRVPIDRVFTPEQTAEAHRQVETERRIGNVVITQHVAR